MDWATFRSEFPSLDRFTYLNTAGGGPVCSAAAGAARAYYDEAERLADTPWDDWLERVRVVRKRVARFVGAEPERIAFLQNTSLAMNILARMFEAPLDVLALDVEFPSCTMPWINAGHRVRFLDTANTGSITPDILEKCLRPTDNVFVLSSVQFATGYRADLHALGSLCKDAGVRFVVDATQSICAYELNLEAAQIDALVFSGYKWAAAGYGIAALCLSQETSKLPAPLVGWRSAAAPYLLQNDRLDLTQQGVVHEMGHPCFPGIFALGAAISLFEGVGVDRVSARIDTLCLELRRRLRAFGFEITSTVAEHTTSGIIRVAVLDSDAWAAALQKRNVYVSSRRGSLRFSVHAFNNEQDIDSLMNALNEIRETKGAPEVAPRG